MFQYSASMHYYIMKNNSLCNKNNQQVYQYIVYSLLFMVKIQILLFTVFPMTYFFVFCSGLNQYYVTFRCKNTDQQAKGRRQNGKDLHSYSAFSWRADISRDECDPDCTEYQHTKGDELGLIEIIRQFPGQKCKNQTYCSKDSYIP